MKNVLNQDSTLDAVPATVTAPDTVSIEIAAVDREDFLQGSQCCFRIVVEPDCSDTHG